jgi:predicted Zn finger-like uncharacterized protein
MRLVCLECSAVYEAPDSLFGPQPREVRCNRCGYQWTVVGSRPEDDAAPTGLSIGPADSSAPSPPQPAEPPRLRSSVGPLTRSEPVSAPPPPSVAFPPQRSARLADSLAGPLTPADTPPAKEYPRPMAVVEPAAESTRTLLAGAAIGDTRLAPPDPEERRLSHELDFDEAERLRRTGEAGGGTRRLVVLIIVCLIALGIAAVVFETQVVALLPALKPIYGQLGL